MKMYHHLQGELDFVKKLYLISWTDSSTDVLNTEVFHGGIRDAEKYVKTLMRWEIESDKTGAGEMNFVGAGRLTPAGWTQWDDHHTDYWIKAIDLLDVVTPPQKD